MTLGLKLDRLATHYVNIGSKRLDYADDEQDVGRLDEEIKTFFLNLVSEVWKAQDTGDISSARFAKGSVVHQCVARILKSGDGFFDTSKELAHYLYQKTHPNASPGLLAVMRVTRTTDSCAFVVLLKIRHKDESFVRALGKALTQLTVEHVQNMLIPEIQKGAITPHPDRTGYDLKVIDKQVGGVEPAKYFKTFLGCDTKQSDEHQLRRLLPEICRYGEARNLTCKKERLHRVVHTLAGTEGNITTARVAKAVHEHAIFGPKFDMDDFAKFVEKESDLGPIDIPHDRFLQSGKTAQSARQQFYRFKDPKYPGLVISGPPDIFDKIVSIEGDKVIFRVQTTRDGYDEFYD